MAISPFIDRTRFYQSSCPPKSSFPLLGLPHGIFLPPWFLRLCLSFNSVLGWIYTLSWSLSFYPQPYLNYCRQSTTGTSFSYPLLNILGFSAYVVSTTSLYASPLIRAQYAARNPVSLEPTVRLNDVFFGAHALFWSIISCSMYLRPVWGLGWGYEQGSVGQWRIGKGTMGIMAGCISAIAWLIALVLSMGKNGGKDPDTWAWIDVVYALGFVKLVITLVKYMPQVIENHKRQSTVGWSSKQVVFDFIGGILSIMQLVVDSSLQNDWSGLINNPTKLGLGMITILFDLILLIQHYFLYYEIESGGVESQSEETSLLSDTGPTLR